MVYSMDVDQQVHRARQICSSTSRPTRKFCSAASRTSSPDWIWRRPGCRRAMWRRPAPWRRKVLAEPEVTPQAKADAARAHFIMARVDLLTVHPGESEDQAEKAVGDAIAQFQKTLEASKDQRLLSWSHIYLGRVLDLECKRDAAVAEYNAGHGDARRATGYAAGGRARPQSSVYREWPQLRRGRRRRFGSAAGAPERKAAERAAVPPAPARCAQCRSSTAICAARKRASYAWAESLQCGSLKRCWGTRSAVPRS